MSFRVERFVGPPLPTPAEVTHPTLSRNKPFQVSGILKPPRLPTLRYWVLRVHSFQGKGVAVSREEGGRCIPKEGRKTRFIRGAIAAKLTPGRGPGRGGGGTGDRGVAVQVFVYG